MEQALKLAKLRALMAFMKLKKRFPDRFKGQSLPGGFRFLVPLKRDDGDYSLSISFPLDYQLLETLLVLENKNVYVEEWGYSDVCRGFGTGNPMDSETINALVEEIRRIESLPSVAPADN